MNSSENAGLARRDDGVLVVVRPEVVETADHVLGNLFQRLYHHAERLGRSDPTLAAELSATVGEFEECLQLLLDYVAPFPPVAARIPASEIVESIVGNLAPGTEATLMALTANVEGVSLAIDAGRAARALALLRMQLAPDEYDAGRTRVRAQRMDRHLAVTIDLPPHRVATWTSVADLRWAVAEKLLEIHGGTLDRSAAASGEIRWKITLPIVS